MNLQNYRPLGPKTTGEVTWRTRNPKRGNLQIQSPAEPQAFKTSRSGDQDLMAWWSGSAETTNPRQTRRVWLQIFSMPVCVCASILPVRWRTSPLARPGLASGVEPERLWTGWRPAGSPYSRRYPSHAPWTHTEQEHGNTPTHSSTHTQHTHRNMWSAITMNVDGWSSCWRPVSLSLSCLTPQTMKSVCLLLLFACLSLSLSVSLSLSLTAATATAAAAAAADASAADPDEACLAAVLLCVCLSEMCVCVCERVWARVADQSVNPPPLLPHTKKERESRPPPSLSLSLPAAVSVQLAPPSLHPLSASSDNEPSAATGPAHQHTHTCSAVSNLTLDQLCVFSLVYNKQDLLLNM